ncbi:Purine-cytosine permease FCY21 [Nakaseomyces bracarensis]|uniref:Purine-cytosine permease FCY21 n=1 Tax=Nakaseomyces bracarensis TaxID=273131 RepID=A0ABR4NS19_9SACH
MELNYRLHDDRDSEGNSHDYELNDVEKPMTDVKTTNVDSAEFDYYEDESAEASLEETKLSFISRLALSLNAETKGIEPVTEEEKTDDSVLNASSMWFSANMVIASYALGALGPIVFGLNFAQSVLVIFFFNIMGLVSVAFFSVFGAEFGLRQMILSRFLLGNVTARIFAVINIVACVGWGVVNTVVSAQLLHMVNRGPHELPLWGGCLVIVGATVLVTFFGYNIIHAYERWSWVPNFAVFLVIIARLHKSGQFSNGPWTSGATTAGSVLSFGSAIYGFAAGYTTYAADYTVYMPKSVNKYKIFFSICAGLAFPLLFTMILGAASAMGAVNNPEWMALYESDNMGGLTYAILVPNSLHGFGEFCCVLLAMSTVANNIPNMYTIALSVQALWAPLAKVPRVIWTLCGNAAVVGISIPASYYFEGFMQNFMDSIGYYLAIYVGISVSEHFFYRRGFKGYNIEDWDNLKKLPIGIAGCAALFVGAVGVALGMSQTYWTGEIGRKIGKFGGDIGFELGLSWAFVVYNIVRPFEIKYFGR